jgi:hypothetical protein
MSSSFGEMAVLEISGEGSVATQRRPASSNALISSKQHGMESPTDSRVEIVEVMFTALCGRAACGPERDYRIGTEARVLRNRQPIGM